MALGETVESVWSHPHPSGQREGREGSEPQRLLLSITIPVTTSWSRASF